MRRIAYLMSWFPAMTETFILNEILDLERLGMSVEIFPLFGSRCGAFHGGSQELVQRTQYNRLLSWEMWRAQIYWLRADPRAYLEALWAVILAHRAAPFILVRALVVFPKAALLAIRIRDQGLPHVHAHWATYPALAAWIIHRLTKIPYSFTAHAHDLYVDRSMLREKVDAASFVVTISEFNRRLLMGHCGLAVAGKLFVVPCGVDVERFRPVNRVVVPHVHTLLCVAGLRDYKGHRYLVDACALLRDRGVQLRCLLVGAGPERRRIARQIRRHRLEQVEMLGALPQEEVRRLLGEVDAFVLPSILTRRGQMEGIPVSLMEAMAAGVPVVTTALSGVPELVEHDKTGLLVPPADSPSLADAIETLLADAGLRRRLAIAGRGKVVRDFDRAASVQRLAGLFERRLDAVRPALLRRKQPPAAPAPSSVR